jgi:hypothetical protein
MPPLNTVRTPSGEIMTGRLWRLNHPFFKNLPFYCDILRREDIACDLSEVFGENAVEGCYKSLLIVSHLCVWSFGF